MWLAFLQTGRGRTAVVAACLLTWLGEFKNAVTALDYVCEARALTAKAINLTQGGGVGGVDVQCTPSQLRYVQYFSYVLDGVKPSSGAMILRRVIMNGIPIYEQLPIAADAVATPTGSEQPDTPAATPGAQDVDTADGEAPTPSEVDTLLAALPSREALAADVAHVAKSAESALEGMSAAVSIVGHAAGRAAVRAKEFLRGDGMGEGLHAADEEDADDAAARSPSVPAVIVPDTEYVPSVAAAVAVPQMCGGCRPSLQLFRNSKLVFSSTWAVAEGADVVPSADVPAWVSPADGAVRFEPNSALADDVLIRCRHHALDGMRETMWRTQFHVGYVSGNMLRLSKRQLDGACNDDRFDDNFFVELVFAPFVSTETDAAGASGGESDARAPEVEGTLRVLPGDVASLASVEQEASSFWDDIHARIRQRKPLLSNTGMSAAAPDAKGTTAVAGSGASGGGPVSGRGPTLEHIIRHPRTTQPRRASAAAGVSATRIKAIASEMAASSSTAPLSPARAATPLHTASGTPSSIAASSSGAVAKNRASMHTPVASPIAATATSQNVAHSLSAHEDIAHASSMAGALDDIAALEQELSVLSSPASAAATPSSHSGIKPAGSIAGTPTAVVTMPASTSSAAGGGDDAVDEFESFLTTL